MQVAILIVLIVIAVILAPWLIGVALALVTLYGAWIVVVAVGVVVGLLILAIILSGGEAIATKLRSSRPNKTEQMIAEANQKFRADAAEEARIAEEKNVALKHAAAEYRLRNYRTCPHCNEQIPKFGLFCPHCGKDSKASI